MTKKIPEAEALELMEQAFCADAGDPVQEKLQALLKEQPELNPFWEEFLTLRQGMAQLESWESPSELTRNRILQAGRKARSPAKGGQPNRVWRWLLSQPVVAAATIALFIGLGIYSHYWRQENVPQIQPSATPQKIQPARPKSPPPSDQEPKGKSLEEPVGETKEPFEKSDTLNRKRAAPKSKALPSLAPAAAPIEGKGEATAPSPEPKPLGASSGGTAPGLQDSALEESPYRMSPEAPAARKLKAQPNERSQAKETSLDQAMEKPSLVDQAKTLMEQKKYKEALVLLKQAQKINDTKEIRQLISQCRAALMKQ